MGFEEIQLIEDRFQVETYHKLGLAVARGSGSWIWSNDGEKYLDLYGGHAVCATGHSHPHVVQAIKDQAERVIFYSNLVYSEIRGKAAEKLVSVAPDELNKVFFCNSGTEANENSMRMARMATGREKVVSFSGGFHGRTADAISASFLGNYRKIGKPNVPFHIEAKFGNIESVQAGIDNETAAVIIEPIQSMAGVSEAEADFFVELRRLCDEKGAILIFDEVQTGLGRTGKWFFSGSDLAGGVLPDILTLAKSLGSGIPVGACLVNEKISDNLKTNDLGTTFGGGMIAMAAVLATLEAIENDDMLANAGRIEQQLRVSLRDHSSVVRLRGKGCLLGVEFDRPCKAVHQHLFQSKIITGTSSDPYVLRILAPLCTTHDEINRFVEVLNGEFFNDI